MGLLDGIKTGMTVKEIKQINWSARGGDFGIVINGFADDALGKKNNKSLFKTIIWAANQFVMGMTKKLNELIG